MKNIIQFVSEHSYDSKTRSILGIRVSKIIYIRYKKYNVIICCCSYILTCGQRILD